VSRQIEFGNDGLIDSLTHVMAPALFYQNFQREMSAADRQGRNISVISIWLKLGKNEKSIKPADFEEQLIKLGFGISANLRGDEFLTRIFENGFLIAIRGNESEAGSALQRICARVEETLKAGWILGELRIQSFTLERKVKESLLDFLDRIDEAQFGIR
jgi:GGDEF domain-containing protein